MARHPGSRRPGETSGPPRGRQTSRVELRGGLSRDDDQHMPRRPVGIPADASVWLKFGEARFAVEGDLPALEAYRFAERADPEDADTRRAVPHIEQVLRLDPTRRAGNVLDVGMRSCSVFWPPLLPVEHLRRATRQPLLKKRSVRLEAPGSEDAGRPQHLQGCLCALQNGPCVNAHPRKGRGIAAKRPSLLRDGCRTARERPV